MNYVGDIGILEKFYITHNDVVGRYFFYDDVLTIMLFYYIYSEITKILVVTKNNLPAYNEINIISTIY